MSTIPEKARARTQKEKALQELADSAGHLIGLLRLDMDTEPVHGAYLGGGRMVKRKGKLSLLVGGNYRKERLGHATVGLVEFREAADRALNALGRAWKVCGRMQALNNISVFVTQTRGLNNELWKFEEGCPPGADCNHATVGVRVPPYIEEAKNACEYIMLNLRAIAAQPLKKDPRKRGARRQYDSTSDARIEFAWKNGEHDGTYAGLARVLGGGLTDEKVKQALDRHRHRPH